MTWPLAPLVWWVAAWLAASASAAAGAPALAALAVGIAVGALGAWRQHGGWRRAIVFAGYPVLALGLALAAAWQLSPWWWTLPLLLLLLVYPVRAWRDAPVFSTSPASIAGLSAAVPLQRQDGQAPAILDGGCGTGAALRALAAEYPHARLVGIERSALLAALCAITARPARVRCGDFWAEDWSAYDMVYLFQRPETMDRAADKAGRELRPGAWLVSLEFPALGLRPHAQLQPRGGRTVWVYRAPFTAVRTR